MYTCSLYGVGRNDFDAGNIHYKGHWKGWALKIETFLGPEMVTSKPLLFSSFRLCWKHRINTVAAVVHNKEA